MLVRACSEARDRPDLVRAVMEKARKEGLRNTFAPCATNFRPQPLSDTAQPNRDWRRRRRQRLPHRRSRGLSRSRVCFTREAISYREIFAYNYQPELRSKACALGTLGCDRFAGSPIGDPNSRRSVVVIGLGLVGH